MASQVATPPQAGAEAVAAPLPELSVVIKALNEAGKIEACLRSVLAATDSATTEIREPSELRATFLLFALVLLIPALFGLALLGLR